METQNELRTPEDFAKNYPVVDAMNGLAGPVTVGNIAATKDAKRLIINLNCRTIKSGARNASYSIPMDWKNSLETGDYVNVLMVDGYVKKAILAKVQSLTSKVSRSNAETLAAKSASEQLDAAIKEGEIPVDKSDDATSFEEEKTSEQPVTAETAVAVEDEKPF